MLSVKQKKEMIKAVFEEIDSQNVNHMNDGLHVSVVHYKKLTDRKNNLQTMFNQQNIHANWYSDIDRDTLTFEQMSMYDPTPSRFYDVCKIFKDPSPYRPLSKPEIAATISHLNLYQMMIDKNIPSLLILEDDVILHIDFKMNLQKYMHQLPSDFDMLFLSDSFGWKIDTYKQGFLGSLNTNKYVQGTNVYKMYSSRTADAYVISLEGAKKMLKASSTFTLPIDYEMNYAILKNDMQVYWAEPAICSQGTLIGNYESSIRQSVEDVQNEFLRDN